MQCAVVAARRAAFRLCGARPHPAWRFRAEMSGATHITPSSAPKLAPQIRLRFDEARQRWTLLAPERVLIPDEIAVEILQLCDGEATVDAISEVLASKFQAPVTEVRNDVIEMLQDLVDK